MQPKADTQLRSILDQVKIFPKYLEFLGVGTQILSQIQKLLKLES